MNLDAIRSTLYPRQRVAFFTGLDDSTLNYWMREGVLRASAGGNGRGQHRRFPYHQINLALLLDQLRSFGVGAPALLALADKFHAAIEYMDRFLLTRDNEEPVGDAIRIRHEFEQKGFVDISIGSHAVPPLVEHCSWAADKEFTSRHYQRSYVNLKATLEEAFDYHLKVPLIHVVARAETEKRYGKDDSYQCFDQRAITTAMSVDIKNYLEAKRYWTPITAIGQRYADEYYSSTPEVLYRRETGEWDIGVDPTNLPATVVSYVGIDLDQLTYRVWSKA